MSGSSAKADRRSIRRAFGDEAIGVIDKQGHAINELMAGSREAFAQQKAELARLSDRVQALENQYAELQQLFERRRDHIDALVVEQHRRLRQKPVQRVRDFLFTKP